MKYELKLLVGASLSEQAVEEVNLAMNVLVVKQMSLEAKSAVRTLQYHLFDVASDRLEDTGSD